MSSTEAAPLSVAIIRARYNPHGGAERFVQRALAALSGRALTLTIVARDWQHGGPVAGDARGGGAPVPTAGEGLPAGVAFERVDPFYIGNVWRDRSFARAVQRHLAAGRYQLVQSHERIPGVMLYRAGDGVHAEFLAQRERVLTPLQRLGLRLNPYHRYTLRAERRMFEHPALRAVICNSEMVRAEIAARFAIDPAKLVVIRNGVDVARYQPPDVAARTAARASFGLDAVRPVFAFVGSGFERKGLAAALRALAMPAAPADALLLVAGRDKRMSRYKALAATLGISDRVRFLGGVDDVRPVLQAADGFVLPTLYDPFPNAVLEALACGLPAITSRKSGAAEVITDGVNGYVTDALDLAAIAAAMTAIARSLHDPQRAAAMRAAARASVEAYSLSALGDDLVALYQRLGAGEPVSQVGAAAGSTAG